MKRAAAHGQCRRAGQVFEWEQQWPTASTRRRRHSWFDCLWERTGHDGAPVHVLPDGCIDVVWTCGSATRVVGANTTAFLVAVSARTHVVGARLRPGGAPALLDLSAELVLNARPPATR